MGLNEWLNNLAKKTMSSIDHNDDWAAIRYQAEREAAESKARIEAEGVSQDDTPTGDLNDKT